MSPRRIKLRPPRLPGDLVARPRLLARLNRLAALSLITAPAGYGKTTLVTTWLTQIELPSAWLSLDEEDNEPSFFLAGVITAVSTVFPAFGHTLLQTLNSPHSRLFTELTAMLMNELDELEDEFVLVLDDYHLIKEPAIHRLLVELVTYPPRALHLVIATRHDPPLPWHVRARGSLCELRATDLGFTEAEAWQFLEKASVLPAAESTVHALVERSQGWITSLRLAALVMRQQPADAASPDLITASRRNLAGYFSTELLANLPPGVLTFLLRTSVLELLSGPLCDFVVDDSAPGVRGATLLRELEANGAFIAALDDEGTWYRYHPLLRQVLRYQLDQHAQAPEITRLYERACAWHEERDLLDEALTYALASGQLEHAVDFLARHRHQLLDKMEFGRLDRWLKQFPPSAIAGHPDLLLTRAWIDQIGYNLLDIRVDLDQLDALLAAIAADTPAVPGWHAEIAALRSQQCVLAGSGTDAVATAQRALEGAPPNWFYVRSFAMTQFAFGWQMAGDLQSSLDFLDAFAADPHIPRDLAIARSLHLRHFVELAAANLTAIRATSAKLLQMVTARDLKTSIAWAHYFWACACYLQNDLHGAAEHFSAVLELVDHAHTAAYIHSAIGLALTHQAQGLPQAAVSTLEEAKAHLAARNQHYPLQVADAFAADLAARQGRVEEALRWVARAARQSSFDATPHFYVPGLAIVRVLLAAGSDGNLQDAQTWLDRQLDLATRTNNTNAQIQSFALAAILHDARGDRAQASAALSRALSLAENGAAMRAFVDLGRQLVPLFDSLAQHEQATGFAARVFAAIEMDVENQARAAARSAAVSRTADVARLDGETAATANAQNGTAEERDLRELLTYREMDVLKLLEKRLTNKEIAHQLGISTETVRQHTVNLFRKLNVENRRQAIVVARSKYHFDDHD